MTRMATHARRTTTTQPKSTGPPRALSELAPFDEAGNVHVVVESPKGSTVKLKYESALPAFVVTRGLPLGVAYPYDWGFIPGTLALDGDPVDALVLHDAGTYPGVVLSCIVIGMVLVRKDTEAAGRVDDARVIAVPTWNDRLGPLERATDLPKRMREELEQFLLSTTFFTDKRTELRGWKGKSAAQALIRRFVRR